jgi:hypothetical protein
MAGSTGETLLVHGSVHESSGVGHEARKRVLSYFLRFESLEDLVRNFTDLDRLLVNRISKEAHVSESFVVNEMGRFLEEIVRLTQFLRSGLISWNANGKGLFRKVRVYLHKIHKIAPVFDYSRAVKNLEILHALLKGSFFWPHITTQLALVVFVTDRNDVSCSGKDYILQKNLRTFCACSAYAFHRARNKLGINKEGNLVKF